MVLPSQQLRICISSVDYPYVAKSDEYVVGVFGGSVAHSFALQARLQFEWLLSERYAGGRKVVLLNFAIGGHKQPQQLTTLSYFAAIGQKFDMVLNLDGFNEAWVGYYNVTISQIDPAMPMGQLTAEGRITWPTAVSKQNRPSSPTPR